MKSHTLAFTLFRSIAVSIFLAAILLLIQVQYSQFTQKPIVGFGGEHMEEMQKMATKAAISAAKNQAIIMAGFSVALFLASNRLARITVLGSQEDELDQTY